MFHCFPSTTQKNEDASHIFPLHPSVCRVGLPIFFCLIFLSSLCRARTASYYQLNDGASHAQIPPAHPGSGLYRVQAPSRAAFTTPLVRLCRYAVMLRHHETLVIIIRALYTMRERARARAQRDPFDDWML